MTYKIKAQAIVLRARRVGENHRGLQVLVSGKGLVDSLAYGAMSRRSSLRNTALPYNRGVAGLHYDGSRRRWRLHSFDPVNTYDGLREDLDRFYTASTWAEILLRSYGSGEDSEALFSLVASALALLSQCMPRGIPRLNCAFLWNFLKIEGVRPELNQCSRCSGDMDGGAVYFLPNGLLICPNCVENGLNELSLGTIRWLLAVSNIELDRAAKIGLPNRSTAAMERWLLSIVQTLLERPLKSLQRQWDCTKGPIESTM